MTEFANGLAVRGESKGEESVRGREREKERERERERGRTGQGETERERDSRRRLQGAHTGGR